MAVKASATITLFDIVDIDSVTIYYLLQSSTANPPSVPTTDNPGGNWTTSEPTYTEGSTNTLYTVTKTKYSDGSFEYTPVSKSSSYEAAKTAYNKAVAAQNTANDVSNDMDNLGTNPIITNINQSITDARGYASELVDGVNQNLTDHYYTITQTNNYVQSQNNQTLEAYEQIVSTRTQNGNTAYDKIVALEAFIVRGQRSDTGKPYISLSTGDPTGYSLDIENDTITIKKGGVAVSTWTSDRFDVKTVITDSLGIGNFDFIVNTDGSVSFRKVRDN